jgi:type IV pilus assembly protein PilE
MQKGLSLVELAVIVAIVGVLAAIALPAYRHHLLRADRGDARDALLSLAAAQEMYYQRCNTYAPTLDADRDTECNPANLKYPTSSGKGLYALEVTSANASEWVAKATVMQGTAQALDTRCHTFGLTSVGARTARTKMGTVSDRECWSR